MTDIIQLFVKKKDWKSTRQDRLHNHLPSVHRFRLLVASDWTKFDKECICHIFPRYKNCWNRTRCHAGTEQSSSKTLMINWKYLTKNFKLPHGAVPSQHRKKGTWLQLCNVIPCSVLNSSWKQAAKFIKINVRKI